MIESIYTKKEEFKMDDIIHHLIEDTRNQFFALEFLEKQKIAIDKIVNSWIPRAIEKNELKTLEDFILKYDNKHIVKITEGFLKINPNIFKEYNELIEGLKNPKLTIEEFKEIMIKEKILLNKIEKPKL